MPYLDAHTLLTFGVVCETRGTSRQMNSSESKEDPGFGP
jgi:hypothetical protein